MPIYVFKCSEEKNGCGHSFEISMSMACVVDKKIKCPKCNKYKAVSRDFGAEHHNVRGDDQTLGSLAERNAARMSDDEKKYLTEKHNAYKKKIPNKKLPKGFKYGKEIQKNR